MNALRALSSRPAVVVAALCVLVLAAGQVISPGFASMLQISNMLVLSCFLGLIAAGQTLVILGGGGGLDLSVGKNVTLGAVVGGIILAGNDANLAHALGGVLLLTFLVGVANGVGVSYFRIPPLVMTMAMSIILIAVIRFITQGVAAGGATPFLQRFISERYAGIPAILFIWAAFIVLLELVFRNTGFGLKLFALGANERVAFLSGVPVRRFRVLLYGLCGMICGFTGFLYLGYLSSVYNTTLGDRFVLPSIIGVAVGGVSLSGGKGNYIGVALGCFLLQVLESFLVTINVDQSVRSILFGVMLICIMLAYGREKR